MRRIFLSSLLSLFSSSSSSSFTSSNQTPNHLFPIASTTILPEERGGQERVGVIGMKEIEVFFFFPFFLFNNNHPTHFFFLREMCGLL